MFWLPLLIVILAGLGVGVYFLRDSPPSSLPNEEQTVDVAGDYSTKTMSEVVGSLESTKGLITYFGPEIITDFESATAKSVFFAPSAKAMQDFSKDTAVLPVKLMSYHVVVDAAADPVVTENKRLKTKDGQELTIIKKDSVLYVRDAKGNDVRLRKPIQTKNGKIYIIDKVLLTQ